ncbi:hypothetical protein CW713_00515 [Methanophagales archaeon]|nr:MAG: hypothetical protein CW713_00515 [Methanophagales archaeon]
MKKEAKSVNTKRKLTGIAFVAIVAISVFTLAASSSRNQFGSSAPVLKPELTISKEEAVPGQVIVGFKDAIKASAQEQKAIVSKYGGKVLKRDTVLNYVLVEVDTKDTQKFIANIKKEKSVKYAGPNYIARALYTPNDPLYVQQWGPQAIKADYAWDTQQGSNSVKIAIVDTGVNYAHEDLAGNYVSGGYDWVNSDNDPDDDNGHGTHCAGIAAAVMNNSKGIAGIAQIQIMAEKVLNENGTGSYWDVAQGIIHAADQGADVISLSLGGTRACWRMREACEYAWKKGCVIVAAAGNSNSGVLYPAAFDTVIAVGALENETNRVRWSNWGPELELVAPGVDIMSTVPTFVNTTGYESWSGTSMATPHVAGVAALVWSNCPAFTNQEVREHLDYTADDLGAPGWDPYYGWGRVDAEEAINCSAVCDIRVEPDSFELAILEDGKREYTLTIGNDGNLTCMFKKYDMLEEIFADDMESCSGNWIHGGTQDEWECGAPDYKNYTSGPLSAHSGDNCWGTDLDNTYNTNADEWLMTPVINLSEASGAILTFYLWYEIEEDYDYGYVEISTDNGSTWTTLRTYTGSSERTWAEEEIDISDYTGSSSRETRIRFRLKSDQVTNKAGLYIDDVLIYEPCDWLSEGVSEGAVYSGSSNNITVACDVAGLGARTSNATIVVRSNDPGESRVDIPVNLTVLPGGTPDIWVVPQDMDEILLWNTKMEKTLTIGNNGDGVLRFNITDTAGTEAFGDDMESGINGWTHSGAEDEWELGTPRYGPRSAHSGDNCWGTDLDGDYENSANQSLVSPVIDLSDAEFASLSFYRWYEIEEGWDKAYVEISTDNGATWDTLKIYTGSEERWTEERIDISNYTGSEEVRIRFRLKSDYSVTKAGLYIDDVEIMAENWLYGTPAEDRVYVGESENITVTFDATHLNAGEYNATIVIWNNDPDENPLNVPVNLVVTAPDIWVVPEAINAALPRDDKEQINLTIGNNGTGTLNYEVIEEEYEIKYDDGDKELAWSVTSGGLGDVFAVCFQNNLSRSLRLEKARLFFSDSRDCDPVVIHVYEQTSPEGPPGAEICNFTTDITGGWTEVDLPAECKVRLEPGECVAIGEEPTVSYSSYLGEDRDEPKDNRSWYWDHREEEWVAWTELQSKGGDFMIRAVGEKVWLSEEPSEGNVTPGESMNVTVRLNTTDLEPGYHYTALVVKSNDPDEPEVEVPVNLTVTTAPPFRRNMTSGWNLISLPLIPDDNSTSVVLSSLSGKYDAVYKYNPVWYNFISANAMDPGAGYFVHATENCTWNYSGSGFAYTSMNRDLEKGLNMLGWLYCSKPVNVSLSSVEKKYTYVARWNATSQSYEVYNPRAPAPFNDFDTMERGEGYWISAKSNCTLTEKCSYS